MKVESRIAFFLISKAGILCLHAFQALPEIILVQITD
jgi:hypothetical protein